MKKKSAVFCQKDFLLVTLLIFTRNLFWKTPKNLSKGHKIDLTFYKDHRFLVFSRRFYLKAEKYRKKDSLRLEELTNADSKSKKISVG